MNSKNIAQGKFPCTEEMKNRIDATQLLTQRAEKLDEELTKKFFDKMKDYPIDCKSPNGNDAIISQGEMTVAGFDTAMVFLNEMSIEDLRLIMATVLAFKVSDKFGEYLRMKGCR
jgi:hypothetical protein